MGFLEAIEKRIDEKRAKWDAQGPSDFDAWDNAELEYMEDARDELMRGVESEAVYERLKAELPELEERVVGEEASYTFDCTTITITRRSSPDVSRPAMSFWNFTSAKDSCCSRNVAPAERIS